MKRSYQGLEVKPEFLKDKKSPKLKVTISYGALESVCEGPVDEVLQFVFRFIRDIYPNYEIVRGLTLTVDLERLLRGLNGIVSFLPKGQPIIMKPIEKLTDSDLVLTYLVATFAASKMNMTERDYLSLAELLEKTSKPAGTVAGRLSELRSRLCVERVGRGKYRVTAYGIKEFMEKILPILEASK